MIEDAICVVIGIAIGHFVPAAWTYLAGLVNKAKAEVESEK